MLSSTRKPWEASYAALVELWHSISPHFPPLNFITLHYLYFLITCLISSLIFWGSSTPFKRIDFTDSLFLIVSAMTEAGLNTVNLSQMNTFQQSLLFFHILIGSAIFVSIAVVRVRQKAFERRFEGILEAKQLRRRARSLSRQPEDRTRSKDPEKARIDGVVVRGSILSQTTPRTLEARRVLEQKVGITGVDSPKPRAHDQTTLPITVEETGPSREVRGVSVSEEAHREDRITFAPRPAALRPRHRRRPLEFHGIGAVHDTTSYPHHTQDQLGEKPIARVTSLTIDMPHITARSHETLPNSNFAGTVARNSQFSHLTEAEREQLGGVEYRAIELLSWVVPLYFFLFQLLGAIGLGAWVARNRPSTARNNGLNPWWVGAFNAISAFNNSGMSLLDANMVAFQSSDYMLLTVGLLILAGNTCYPVFLRAILWTMWRLTPENGRSHDSKLTLRFLLDHPRRCYTNLFPSTHTWWLLATIVCLNGVDWIAFEVLNIGNEAITSLPGGVRAIAGLFQALAVRSGGFYVVTIARMRIGLLILYVLMMYISVYPVVITIRNSNVYEERSLGIYAEDPATAAASNGEDEEAGLGRKLKRAVSLRTAPRESRGYFIRQQLRGQLAHDLWWIVMAVLIIAIIETSSFERDPTNFSVFNILFEVVSAYGCVGISVGNPNAAYSFCGAWHKGSKLILCAVMLRGRHRGLPVAIDRAILLPGEHLARAEDEDAKIRRERSMTMRPAR